MEILLSTLTVAFLLYAADFFKHRKKSKRKTYNTETPTLYQGYIESIWDEIK